MTSLTVIFTGLMYFATIVLIAGIAYRIYEYSRTPAPLVIPTTPAPTTNSRRCVVRMAREVVLFESLFKSNKWIWMFGWLFHVGLAWFCCATFAISRSRSGSGWNSSSRLESMPVS
jgi:nitrate reductase gamma subunit